MLVREALPRLDSRHSCVRMAVSHGLDTEEVISRLIEDLRQPNISLVLFFTSTCFDLDCIAPRLRAEWPDAEIAGCTTTREIAPDGYTANSIVGISFAAPDFHAVTGLIDDLPNFAIARGHQMVRDALSELNAQTVLSDLPMRTFALLLIDGLSRSEETVISSLQSVLGSIPILGGSAGDDLCFQRTLVYQDGAFHERSAVLILVSTRFAFEVFKTEHFVASARRMVVTGAIPTERIVTGINGRPAATEYARLIGVRPEELTPAVFAAHPLVVRSGGGNYVRSIQQVGEDGSLTFMCAIDEGMVLRIAEDTGIVEDLEERLASLRARLGPLQLVIGCECILRFLELEQKGLTGQAGRILSENNVVGFCTYGEQYQSMHINQTFTGVAIGWRNTHDPSQA
ncbi:nitric oxide-sensing protein NosP [Azospirillum sp. TSO22-1]|uniref:nitric oxide-sensing protein NosP n=1 Tax=Azospirillum sp. TSO22-1 TaxID=716789 RepID=UPI0020005472|nr:nitric oxide-sensing protein NosP [Azospirillum sp. TSO22-1]